MSALDKQEGGNHYKDLPIQPVEFCQKNQLNYCESNVIKYVCRHRNKNGKQDIDKAIHYLELLRDIEYPEILPTSDEEWKTKQHHGGQLMTKANELLCAIFPSVRIKQIRIGRTQSRDAD